MADPELTSEQSSDLLPPSPRHMPTIRHHLEHFCSYAVLTPQPGNDDVVAERTVFPSVPGAPKPVNLDKHLDTVADLLDMRCNAMTTGICELAVQSLKRCLEP